MTKLRNFSTEWKQEIADTSEVAGAITNQTKVRYQIKTLPSSISSNTSDIAGLRFSNLVVGRSYKLTLVQNVSLPNNTNRAIWVIAYHNGNILLKTEFWTDNSPNEVRNTSSSQVVFTASATSITFNVTFTNPGQLLGNGTTEFTFSMLEELPNHEVTTQWT